MRSYRSRLFLVLLVSLAAAAGPQAQTGGALQLPTIDSIVALNLKARGGVELLRATESMKMSGTVTLPGAKGKMTKWMKRPNRNRSESELGGQKTVEAYDGATAWAQLGDMPAQIIPPSPQLEEAKGRSEFDPVLLDYKEHGRNVALIGRERSDGGDVFHLRITEKGRVTHYYIDAVTGLDRKMTNRVPSPDGTMAVQVELRFSDYRDVQGRMVPFSVQQFVDGKPVAQTRLETVEFNVPVDDALFKMPGKAPKSEG
jgi:hypothetical protein